jgi:plastocyanin
MKKFLRSLSLVVMLTGYITIVPVYAVKHIVTVGNFFFNPLSVNVTVGDTIRWVWSAGNHTTTSTPGAIPPGAASWDALINNSNTSFEYMVTVAGSYAYVCTPHAPGMAGSFTATGITPTLSVSPPNSNVTSSAGATTFNVVSNTAWSASSNSAWCTVNPNGSGNGTITGNYAANLTNFVRIATITVTGTGLSPQIVTVTQAASTVGVAENKLSGLHVYPNPTNGNFLITTVNLKDQIIEVTLMDLSGKKILSRVCSAQDDY